MRILTFWCIVTILACGYINSTLKASPAPQETPLTIKTVAAFEKESGPYQTIRDRTLKRKLQYEVERILNQ